jgi:DNA-directed RNA polymerase subunit K/omega
VLPFDLDKLGKLIPNRFYMVLAIVDRVRALKKGVEPKVERRKRDHITVAIEELEKNKVEFYVQDNYVSPVVEMLKEKEKERKRLGNRPSFDNDSDAE